MLRNDEVGVRTKKIIGHDLQVAIEAETKAMCLSLIRSLPITKVIQKKEKRRKYGIRGLIKKMIAIEIFLRHLGGQCADYQNLFLIKIDPQNLTTMIFELNLTSPTTFGIVH